MDHSSFSNGTAALDVGRSRPSVTTSTGAHRGPTNVTSPSTTISPVPIADMDVADDLQHRISLGSAAACLDAANSLEADLPHDALQWSRAAMFYIIGIIWDTFLPHSAHCPDRSTGALVGSSCGCYDPSSSANSDLSPLARTLIINLTSLILRSPLRRYEFTLPDLPTVASRIHRTTLMEVLNSIGRTDENPHVSIATLSYRLANEFLLADELLPSLRVGNGKTLEANGHAQATDRSLLAELSRAASSSKTKSECSSSMTAADDDSVSAGSSYPATPLTRAREEIDLDESPATTPSQQSSTEDLTKTFAPPTTTFRNILQERLSHKIDTDVPRHPHTRSSSFSFASSPASARSLSSIRSTASSIFAHVCGSPKSTSTVSLIAEPASTMGSFTPVPATTAAGSLRKYGGIEKQGSSRSRLGLPPQWQDAPTPGAGPSRTPSKPVQRHGRSATIAVVPSISLTHSSFQPESVLDSKFSPRRSSSTLSSPVEPPQKPFAMAPALLERHTLGGARGKAPKLPVARAQSSPFPPLDPTLAALEKKCRFRSKVTCAACEKLGWDFPKNRDGQALCSRECRVALKSRNCSPLPTGSTMICA